MSAALTSFGVLLLVVLSIPLVLWLVKRLSQLPAGRARTVRPAPGGKSGIRLAAGGPAEEEYPMKPRMLWGALLAGVPLDVWAQTTLSLQSAAAADGGTTWSVPVQTLLFFSALSFIPAVLLLMTSFTRIIIVLSLLRQALGLQASPPNQVLVGISLFLTAFIMSPTLDRIYTEAYQPLAEKRIDFETALQKGSVPLRDFMLKQTRASDLELFARLARVKAPDDKPLSAQDMPFKAIVPAFVISELKTAFQIGFMIFIPFILIDLICASVLMSLGMMMVSPVLVALPFKLVLFVLADGWNLLVGSLVASFAT